MKTVSLVLIVCFLSACATIMHGSSQDVGISSAPTGATVSVDNQSTGQTPYIAYLAKTITSSKSASTGTRPQN